MIELVNLRNYRAPDTQTRVDLVRRAFPGRQVIYVGRGGVDGRISPLHNPYRESDGERAEIIAKFKRDLWEKIKRKDKATLDALAEIGPDAILCCWCVPLDCHSMVIKAAVEWMRKSSQ